MTSTPDLLAAIERAAARDPDRRALVPPAACGRDPLSYRALVDRVREAAAALRGAGVRPGERIGVLAPDSDRLVVALLAIQTAGGVAVLLDPTLGPAERRAQLVAGRPARLVTAGVHARPAGMLAHDLEGLRTRRDVAVEPAPGRAPALVAFTSGTAGRPRAVVLSRGGLAHQIAALSPAVGVREGEATFLSLLGPHHLFELVCGLLAPLATGATVVLAESALPHEILEQAGRERVTHSCVVPALARLLAAGEPCAAAPGWTWLCGGAALDARLELALERRGRGVLAGYGLSEFSPVVSTNRPDARRRGSVGLPLADVDARVIGGELEVRGPSTMLGYLDEPEASRAAFTVDGWLRTGDLATIDPDGFLRVAGRAGDLVVLANGKKVHPDEVEPCLRATGRFRDVCALGLPSDRGAELTAVVVPAAPLSERDAAREVARLTSRLAPWKRPTRVVLRDAPLPRTATWKVRRPALAREIA